MIERVGFGRRLLAACIDLFLITVILATLGPLIGAAFGGALGGLLWSAGEGASGVVEGAVLGMLLGAILGVIAGIPVCSVLYGLVEALTGASPGKMLVGIKIGTSNGVRASIGGLLVRYAVKNCAFLLVLSGGESGILSPVALLALPAGFVVFVGCFLVLRDDRQALHDLIAHTAVYPHDALAKDSRAPYSDTPNR